LGIEIGVLALPGATMVLTHHLHWVLRLPYGNADYSLRWRSIKDDAASGTSLATNRRG
jgi:hypothetical protein